MRTNITTRRITLNEQTETLTEKKMAKLGKFFPEDTIAQVRFSRSRLQEICEITIPFEGRVLRAEVAAEDALTALEGGIARLERQIIKHKTKFDKRLRAMPELPPEETLSEEPVRVVKTKTFSIKPLDVEEAALQMDLLGHNFFAFMNADTGKISVLYRRNDGDLGLLEPDGN